MPVLAAIAERKLIHRLMSADAMSAAAAQPLDGLPWIQSRRLARLLRTGVIRESQPGRFFLYAPALAIHLANRRRRIVVALIAIVILFGLSTAIVEL